MEMPFTLLSFFHDFPAGEFGSLNKKKSLHIPISQSVCYFFSFLFAYSLPPTYSYEACLHLPILLHLPFFGGDLRQE